MLLGASQLRHFANKRTRRHFLAGGETHRGAFPRRIKFHISASDIDDEYFHVPKVSAGERHVAAPETLLLLSYIRPLRRWCSQVIPSSL